MMKQARKIYLNIHCCRIYTPKVNSLTCIAGNISGFDNSMEMSQLYNLTYTCDSDLTMFHFDAQVNHRNLTHT